MNKIQITENEVHDRIFYRKKHKNKELNNALYEKYQSIHDDTGKEDKDKYVSEIFNLAYTIYDNLSKEQDFPEDTVDDLYDMVQKKYNEAHPFCDIVDPDYDPLKEYISIVFVFAYVILNNSGCSYEEFPCAMKRIERIIKEDYFEKFKPLLKKEINTSDLPSSQVYRKERIKAVILSFMYTKLGSESNNINLLFSELKENGYLPSDLPITEFKHLFSGVEVSNPIPWIGNKSDLAYLFKLLVNMRNVLELPSKVTIWDIVDACFVDRNGEHFGKDSLRKQQKPKKTANDIEYFASLMA